MGSWFSKEKQGDLIEIDRYGYKHWALYAGYGYVIHLAPASGFSTADSLKINPTFTTKGKVRKELLKDVARGQGYRVNNKWDGLYKPLPVNKIISSANKKLGEEAEYNILMKNCEHFVTELRYGKARSLQTTQQQGRPLRWTKDWGHYDVSLWVHRL
ncbi:phospholipase A and acyltransferase 2-like [Pteronotus mesoamericanus]|uniref:phospholipase A and acyltransferase 2-like n=1 Tax=Pteronotus mesoamericanus TaxID=1884717 RepID=UPI0023EC0A2A|nr:phospholipase A and acyltransferase 2-like [Pteronotus parnellii mesoamericanus]